MVGPAQAERVLPGLLHRAARLRRCQYSRSAAKKRSQARSTPRSATAARTRARAWSNPAASSAKFRRRRRKASWWASSRGNGTSAPLPDECGPHPVPLQRPTVVRRSAGGLHASHGRAGPPLDHRFAHQAVRVYEVRGRLDHEEQAPPAGRRQVHRRERAPPGVPRSRLAPAHIADAGQPFGRSAVRGQRQVRHPVDEARARFMQQPFPQPADEGVVLDERGQAHRRRRPPPAAACPTE